jgi:hypothetical protein
MNRHQNTARRRDAGLGPARLHQTTGSEGMTGVPRNETDGDRPAPRAPGGWASPRDRQVAAGLGCRTRRPG